MSRLNSALPLRWPGITRSLSPKVLAKAAMHLPAALVALPLLTLVALWTRWRPFRRAAPGARPRLFWGPVGIIGIKYWSSALREMGYESRTFVNNYFSINSRADFDMVRREMWGGPSKADTLKAYPALGWALLHHDVFTFFFDGGLLGDTPFWWAEAPLLKLAAKKIVMMPYGRDIAVPGYLGPYEEAMDVDYPLDVGRGPAVRRRVDHFCRRADLVIANLQVGYLPRRDVLWANQIAIDTDLWRPDEGGPEHRNSDDEVVVVHAPNHRALKGTPALLEAIDLLRAEGANIRLELVEHQPNEVLRQKVASSDIVVDQLLCGFGFFAVECMSAGKPVLSNIGWMPPKLRSVPDIAECPVVDADPTTVAAVLMQLAGDPALRGRVGEAGREWALKHHSYQAVGAIWDAIFRHVCEGTPLPVAVRVT